LSAWEPYLKSSDLVAKLSSTPPQSFHSPSPSIDPHKSNLAPRLKPVRVRKAVFGQCIGLARKRKNGFAQMEMFVDAVLTTEESMAKNSKV
jgi:hypothetical protein